MDIGKHLIAGVWVETPEHFWSSPASGDARAYCQGTPELVDQAVSAAVSAFPAFAATSRSHRAAFLRQIAEDIEAEGARITEVGMAETGLPEARLEGLPPSGGSV